MKIEYSVKFSARRTLALKIGVNGNISVHCPYGTPRGKISDFVSKNSKWIEKHLKSIERRNLEFSEIIGYRKILVNGRAVDFSLCEIDCFASDKICVTSLKKLRKLYVDNLSADFLKIFDEVCSIYCLHARSVKFKDYKSMWGCCDSKNNVSFNYKTLMLPERLQFYVIVHELCHTVQHDHSEKFWEKVACIAPDYKLLKKLIKDYSVLTRLY